MQRETKRTIFTRKTTSERIRQNSKPNNIHEKELKRKTKYYQIVYSVFGRLKPEVHRSVTEFGVLNPLRL